MQYDPANFAREFIQSSQDLERVRSRLTGADALGVDLEMAQRPERRPGGVQEWVQVLALIQIASDDYSVVIDPVRCNDLSPLRPLMAGPARKVFLGGGQDASLLDRAGIPAVTVVDVGEVALALFGRREDGMAALSRRIFDLSLDKTVRRTDWLARPLNPTLLAYAHRDAELTLLIYRWLQRAHPQVLAAHQRAVIDPVFSASVPQWIREATERSQVDVLAVVMGAGMDPARDAERLERDVRRALDVCTAPRQVNRLLRVAAELGLKELGPAVASYAESPSALVRAAAARALGRVGERDVHAPLLQSLKQDPIEDVRKAAEVGLRDLRERRAPTPARDEDDEPSLSDAAMLVLGRLREQLEREEG